MFRYGWACSLSGNESAWKMKQVMSPLLHLGSLYFCWPCKMQMLCRCCCIATHLQGQLAVKGYEYFTQHKMVESKVLIPKPFLLAKSVQHSLWLEHSFFWLNFEVHWLLTVDLYQAPFLTPLGRSREGQFNESFFLFFFYFSFEFLS